MRSSHLIAICGVVAFSIVGCGSSSDGDDVEDKPTNAAACKEFETANNTLVNFQNNGKQAMTLEAWKQAQDDLAADFDAASLHAYGDVKERLNALVADLPDKMLSIGLVSDPARAAYSKNQRRVEAACEADGQPVRIVTSGLPN